MPKRSHLFLAGCLLLVTGITAVFLRKGRSAAFGVHRSYNRLYFSPDQLHITGIRPRSDDVLEISFAGAVLRSLNRFEVFTGGARVHDQQAARLSFRPVKGKGPQIYLVRINGLDSFSMQIEMPQVSIVSLPVVPVVPGALEAPGVWCMDDSLSAGDTEVRHYLLDSMHIRPGDGSELRVSKIARYLWSVTGDKYGVPSKVLDGLSPAGQLQCIQRGESRLLCGGYAYLFSYFCNKAGVPCRYIETGGLLDDISYSPHVVNEVWLKEKGCWAYSDPTEGIAFVKRNDRYLNVVDIQRLLRYRSSGGDSSLRAFSCAGDSLLVRPFEKASVYALQDFDYNNVFTFYYGHYFRFSHPSGIGAKLESLLSPAPWYAIYSDNQDAGDLLFYARIVSGYLFFLSGLCWLGLVIIYCGQRHRRRL